MDNEANWVKSRASRVVMFCLAYFGLFANLSAVELNPLVNAGLSIVRPSDFNHSDETPAESTRIKGAVFDGMGLEISKPLYANLALRRSGTYTLWIRAGRPSTEVSALHARLSGEDGKHVYLEGRFQDDAGSPERGGPEGWEAYRKQAIRNTSPDTAVADVRSAMLIRAPDRIGTTTETDPLADELLAEIRAESGAHFTHLARLEHPGENAFTWWRIGAVDLPSGSFQLRIAPEGDIQSASPPVVDAAFLTDSPYVIYPFSEDINAPRASYIRFRLDRIPDAGLGISATLFTGGTPKRIPGQHLNPDGISTDRQHVHTETGYTRWFCIQEFEYNKPGSRHRAPGLNRTRDVCLYLNLSSTEGVEGSTQFAVFPFRDAVVREIGWDEPAGRRVSMAMDFAAYPHQLRTIRDQAREHYDFAVQAAGGQLHPLTRGALYFRTSSLVEHDDALDYASKTLRLLGINNARTADMPAMRDRYGWWNSAGGAARMRVHLPFDEAETRRFYETVYSHYADPDRRPVLENVHAMCMTDEMGEQSRNPMSSPLWIYVDEPDQPPKWVDYTGRSELHTRAVDYMDMVLEGWVNRIGGREIEFRVATDSPVPDQFAFWRVGLNVAGETPPSNVMVGRGRVGDDRRVLRRQQEHFYHRESPVRTHRPARFKIIYERGMAAFFLNDVIVHQHTDLPKRGGFGFAGHAKEIWGLRLRPIRPNERLAVDSAFPDDPLADTAEADATRMTLEDPEVEREVKPLKDWIEQDWVVSGGIPGAQDGFRRWVAAKGVTPDHFGATSWDDVRMLTMSHLVKSPSDARRLYWGRRYSGYLTPRMWSLAMDGIRTHHPNPEVRSYPALSGAGPNIRARFPVDMFEIASYDNGLMPGISDWHTHNAESEQVNAFSAAMFNAGARRYGDTPASISFMHCVNPSTLRTYASFGANVKYISFFKFGPHYRDGGWSGNYRSYEATSLLANRAAQADDLAAPGLLRPSRVALLYAMSGEYWGHASMADKRAAFLALSHEYFQPEIVNEDHVRDGALAHFDALYVLDAHLADWTRGPIADWVRSGGLLWISSDAATRNQYNEPDDLLADLAECFREFAPLATTHSDEPVDEADLEFAAEDESEELEADPGEDDEDMQEEPYHAADQGRLVVSPVEGEADFRQHTVRPEQVPNAVKWDGARIRARYQDGRPAWLENSVGRGRVVVIGHRAGLTTADHVIRVRRVRGGSAWGLSSTHLVPYVRAGAARRRNRWADTGRTLLTRPLHESGISRELILSEPLFIASPLDSPEGTLIVLYNMHGIPREGVELRLKETDAPTRVETFDGLTRVPLPWQHEDGWLIATLPPFEGGQMVIVRRGSPPPDDRMETWRAQTAAQLVSDDWKTLSAGAFAAGFFPDWGFTEHLRPLLDHPAWQVRRQAVESLGRLADASAVDALMKMVREEPDAHVRGDGLVALARLGHRAIMPLCRDVMAGEDAFARARATVAVRILTFGENGSGDLPEPEIDSFARDIAGQAVLDMDLRVRREGISLLTLLDPEKTLEGAVAAFSARRPDPLAQPYWAEALANNDTAFKRFLQRGDAIETPLLLAVATHRRDDALAEAIAARLSTMEADTAVAYADAAIVQRHPALSLLALRQRSALPDAFHVHIAYILDVTFDERFGHNLDMWDAWSEDRHPISVNP